MVVKGAAILGSEWKSVEGAAADEGDSPGTARPTMRFFKVVVEVP